jgi:hypothetical protein
MREIRLSGSEGGGAKPIDPPYPYTSDWPLRGQEPFQPPYDCLMSKDYLELTFQHMRLCPDGQKMPKGLHVLIQ